MTMTYSQQLRDARQARGWSRRQLAEAVGCKEYTVVNWERGAVPHLATQRRLRAILGIPLAEAHPASDAPTLRDLVYACERTQAEVARAVGISYQGFVHWQKGRMFPNLAHQEALARELGVDVPTVRRAIARSVAASRHAAPPVAAPDTPPSPHPVSETV